MAIKNLPDGQDFDHTHFPKDFGFSGSAQRGGRGRRGPASTTAPHESVATEDGGEMNTEHGNRFAEGGAEHVHPHGHHVVRVEHRHDGSVVHHHDHGGHTVHHADGHITHHDAKGGHVGGTAHGFARGGAAVHAHPHGHHVTHVESLADGSEVHHHAHGGHTIHHADGQVTHHARGGAQIDHGDDAHDKSMIASAIHQHEEHDHRGEKLTDVKLARGGGTRRPRMPRNMKPKASFERTIGGGAPNQRPPANPQRTVTPRNTLDGGQMGYGVEPSAEPDQAGADQADTGLGMRRGGRSEED